MRIWVDDVVRLLLTTAHTSDRVGVAAKRGQRRQLRSRRDGATRAESRLFEVLLISMVVGESGDGGSMVVRVRRHRGHLVGEIAIFVVAADLGLILLHAGGVLSKHGGRTRTAILIVRCHGAHRARGAGADAGFVLGTKVVVLLVVLGHLGRHAACTAVALVGLVVVWDHGRVALEGVPIEGVGLVRIILLPVLLKQEADETR